MCHRDLVTEIYEGAIGWSALRSLDTMTDP